MSLFTSIEQGAEADFESAWSDISDFFHADIEPALKTFFQTLESNGGTALLTLALNTVTSAASGTLFGTLTSTLLSSAEAAGLNVVEGAAKAALTVAQTNIASTLASAANTSTEAPVTPAS